VAPVYGKIIDDMYLLFGMARRTYWVVGGDKYDGSCLGGDKMSAPFNGRHKSTFRESFQWDSFDP